MMISYNVVQQKECPLRSCNRMSPNAVPESVISVVEQVHVEHMRQRLLP